MIAEKETILIVEDDPDSRFFLEKVLCHYGFQTVSVTCGEEALRYCAEHRPSLILMDLSLPNKGGIEVACLLRAPPYRFSLPIIALTAYNVEKITKEIPANTFNHILIKPFLPVQLLSLIQQNLEN